MRSTASRLSATNPGLRRRSSGGYPVTASSGKTATSAPATSAATSAARTRSALPSRSPTTVFSWQAATRSRATPKAYGGSGDRSFDDGRGGTQQVFAIVRPDQLEAGRQPVAG